MRTMVDLGRTDGRTNGYCSTTKTKMDAADVAAAAATAAVVVAVVPSSPPCLNPLSYE